MSFPIRVVRKLRNPWPVVVLAVVLFATAAFPAGCIGESPEEQARAAEGDARDGDEEHRPGQPCLVCHSADYHPGGPSFVLAGTIYRTANDPDERGLEGAEVSVIDDAGHEFRAITNRAGNFMFQVDTGLDAGPDSEPRVRTRGRTTLPWEPVFPLSVAVIYQGEDKSMDSLIWREGSCAGCHRTSEPGEDHVEKVWHTEVAP